MNKHSVFPLWTFVCLMLLGTVGYAGAAYADPTVELQILNATGPSGEIVVVSGENVEVSFNVTLDTAGVLNKNDTMALIDLADNSVVSAKNRGSSTSGSVILTVPNNSLAGQFYVRYMTKDGVTEIARISHPDDVGSIPLLVMVESTTAELTAQIAALEANDSNEVTARIAADTAEATARAAADAAEAASRIAADSAEAAARAAADFMGAVSRATEDARLKAEITANATAVTDNAKADFMEALSRVAEDLRLQAEITANAKGVSDNAANIAALQETTNTLRIDLDNLTSTVDGIEVRVSANETSISDLKFKVSTNSEAISANMLLIKTTKEALAELSLDVVANAGEILSLQYELEILTSQVDVDFAVLRTDMKGFHDILVQEAAEISQLRRDFLESQQTTNDQIQSLLTQINQLQDDLAANAEADLAEQLAYNMIITQLQTQVQTLIAFPAMLDSQLNMLDGRFESHKHSILRAVEHAHYESVLRYQYHTHQGSPHRVCETERHWYTLFITEHEHCSTHYHPYTERHAYWATVFDQYHTHYEPADDLVVSEPSY